MDLQETLKNIQERLDQIELRLNIKPSHLDSTMTITKPLNPFLDLTASERSAPPQATQNNSKQSHDSTTHLNSVSKLLGFGGAAALLIAAVYIIILSIDAGWLTPIRQVAAVFLGGLAMIGLAEFSSRQDRVYASSLAGTGLAMIYIAIYGGHSYYRLIPASTAALSLMITSFVGLNLARTFKTDMLAYITIFGTYLGPYLLRDSSPGIYPLAGYFLFWAILFCSYSIIIQKRSIYLCALYLGLITFHSMSNASSDWTARIGFQFGQLLIFGIGMLAYSIKWKRPMEYAEIISHLPALLVFYFVQYAVLTNGSAHVTLEVMLASAAIILGLYAIAEVKFQKSSVVGAVLASTYISLVVFHAYYLEYLHGSQRLFFALAALPFLGLIVRRPIHVLKYWPAIATLILIAITGALWPFTHYNSDQFPIGIPLLFAVEFYACYFVLRHRIQAPQNMAVLLYASHLYAMAALKYAVENPAGTSLLWGILGVFWMLYAFRTTSQIIAQSSLVIYFVIAVKVLFWDLSNSDALKKIAALIVVSAMFFVGGWMYQKIMKRKDVHS